MDHYEIVKKLIGNFQPVGESNEDQIRFERLIETQALVEKLLADILNASYSANRYEASMKKIGSQAKDFLNEIEIWLCETH